MEILCTICCKEKRKHSGLLPARLRYISKRIDFVGQESRRLNVPYLIFSGKYGLIEPDYEIPDYDKLLKLEDVDEIKILLKQQLTEKRVSAITFYGRAKSTEGWGAYYAAIEQSCEELDIPIHFESFENS